MDDSVLEGEESFILVLRSDSAEVTTRNASVSIQDNDGKSISALKNTVSIIHQFQLADLESHFPLVLLQEIVIIETHFVLTIVVIHLFSPASPSMDTDGPGSMYVAKYFFRERN